MPNATVSSSVFERPRVHDSLRDGRRFFAQWILRGKQLANVQNHIASKRQAGTMVPQNPENSLAKCIQIETTQIHEVIRDCSRQLRLDRWQERKRTTAVQCSAMIDRAVEPIKEMEPNAGQAKLLAIAVKRLRLEVREMLEAGYSVSHIARELGIDRSTLAHTLLDIRKHAS